jgi:hypothetical protein
MKSGLIVKASFIISFITFSIMTFFIMTNVNVSEILLFTCIGTYFVFAGTAISEVIISKKVYTAEKRMWAIAFLFMSFISGFIYFLAGRKRIVSIQKQTK